MVLALSLFAGAGSGHAAETPQYVLQVVVQKARQSDVARPLHVTGFVAAKETRDMAFRVGGTVLERQVQAGDIVHAGQVLARLGTAELEANITAAKAGVASAKASLDLAQSDFDRQKSLLDKGFTTRSSFEQATKTVDVARAQLNIAQSQMQTADDNMSYAVLKAAVDGVVTSVNIEVGQVVQAGQSAVSVATGTQRQGVFDISEAMLATASRDRVNVALAGNPDVTSQAEIVEVAPTVNSRTGTVRIKADLVNPPQGMSLGAAVTGTGRSQTLSGILLPYSALARVDGKPVVWIVDPKTKRVEAHVIEVIEYEGENMLLSGDVKDGDLVVVKGGSFLSPDLAVEYAEEAR
jgi:membrane fusion protein, multidrug efflux system